MYLLVNIKRKLKNYSGKFTFGTNEPLIVDDGEEPARVVTISSDYEIDIYEVTNSEFWYFVQGKDE